MVSFRKPVDPPIFIGDSKMGGPPAYAHYEAGVFDSSTGNGWRYFPNSVEERLCRHFKDSNGTPAWQINP